MTTSQSDLSDMETRPPLQPDIQSLASGLGSVLISPNAGDLTILDRERNAYSSGSLSEIVTCRLADGRMLRLLFKYAQFPAGANYHDASCEPFEVMPWSNVPYEAEVYRQVLEPLRLSTPKFYGTYNEPGTGRLWLVLEHLENATPLDELAETNMCLASSWLGRFHATAEPLANTACLSFLKKVEADYYLAFARRVRAAEWLDSSFSWLPDLCSRFRGIAASTLIRRPTIIHGDYYRNNILLSDGNIHPVDWEQAAIGIGELDLACLTFRWPREIAQQCELEYQKSRWAQGTPSDFETVLNAARLALYLDEMRKLPNWPDRNDRSTFGEEMRSLGEYLKLI
jgi:hypothetical protein